MPGPRQVLVQGIVLGLLGVLLCLLGLLFVFLFLLLLFVKLFGDLVEVVQIFSAEPPSVGGGTGGGSGSRGPDGTQP